MSNAERIPVGKADDAMLLTALKNSQSAYEGLAATFPPERILVPRLLHIDSAGSAETTKR